MSQPNLQSNSIEPIDIKKYHDAERTEEVRDIIERMPTKFGFWITIIVGLIFFMLLIFGWLIRYPDVVVGQITVNTSIAPIKLIANTSGKLHLINVKNNQSTAQAGQVIGYVESATSYDTLQFVKNLLRKYNPNDVSNTGVLKQLPSAPALGELTSKYYNFIASLSQLAEFNNDRFYDKQIINLQNLYSFQRREVYNSLERRDINMGVLSYSQKSLDRDSILFFQKVNSQAEFEQAKLQHLSYSAGFTNAKSNLIDAEKQAQQTESNIMQTRLQKSEKLNEIKITLLAAYNDLMETISLWEESHLFKAPFEGQVQFLKFWTNSQFVQIGEPVFTIVPKVEEPYGQILLPAIGSGKVKRGQQAIIKLNDFPYSEFGSITAIVGEISLTTNTEKTSQGDIESYLVTVKFPNGLTTNYGKPVDFKHEAKGTAEIITNDRRLIERLFDNLKYALN